MPELDPLAGAPIAPETPPAAPVAAPAAPAPASAPGAAPASPLAAAAAPPAPDATAQELAAFKALGLTPAEISRVVGAHQARERQEQADLERRQAEYARTPEGQRVAERRQAMLGLLQETLGPQRLEALIRAADGYESTERTLEGERVEQSRTIMARIAEEHGVTFKDADEKREFERIVAAHIQEDDKLNAAYFNRETREAAIREATSREASRLNRILIAHGASDLKTAAQRRASVPRSTRGGSLAKVTEFKPTSKPGTPAYRNEYRQHGSQAIDAVLESLGL